MAAVAVLTAWACERQPTPPREDQPERARYDEPDEAAEFYAAKRAPLDDRVGGGTPDSRRYDLARARMQGLRRFSSRAGRDLPAVPASATSTRQTSIWGGLSAGSAPFEALMDAWTPLGPGNIGGRSRVMLIDPRDPRSLFAAGVSGGIWKSDDGGESWRPVGFSSTADELANLAVNALAWHPQRAATIYAGTGEGYFREEVRGTGLPLRGAGIYRSDDGGRSWAALASTRAADFYWVNDLIVSQATDRRVYAATRTGVWRSADAGETWTRILATGVMGGCLDLEIRRDRAEDVLFASCGTFAQATVYRFADASGAAPPVAVLSDPGMGRTSLAIAPSAPDVIYALAASNETGIGGSSQQGLHAVFRSVSGGAPGTWEARVTRTDPLKTHRLLLHNAIEGLLEECTFPGPDIFLPMGWYANVIAVDPRDPERVWVAGVDWFRSDDGGRTWGIVSHWWVSEQTPQYAHADQHALVFHPGYDGDRNQTLFIGNDGGLFRTDNARASSARGLYGPCNPFNSGVTWRTLNRGYGVTQFYHGVPLPDGTRVIGGTQDNGTILGGGTTPAEFDGWQRVFGGDGGYVALDPRNPSIIFVETQWAQLRKSTDGGRTFALATTGLDPARETNLSGDSNYLFITPFVMDPSSGLRLWTGGQVIYRTDDGAERWRQVSTPLEDDGGSGGGAGGGEKDEPARPSDTRVSAIAVSPHDPQRVIVGTSTGRIYRHDRALDADARTVWPSSEPRPGWVTSVAYDPRDPQTVYATYGNFGGAHIYRSRDAGQTWRPLDGVNASNGTGNAANADALPDIPVHVIVIDPADPERVYLGTDLGVFVSTTGGDHWQVENTGFGPIVTEWLALQERGPRRTLFAFTHGRGAWRVDLR